MIERLEKILDIEASYVEVCLVETQSTSINLKDEKLEVSSGRSVGVSVRVLNSGWGFSYTSDLSRLKETAEHALRLSKLTQGGEAVTEEVHRDRVELRPKRDFQRVDTEEKVALLRDAQKVALGEKVVSTSLSYTESITRSIYLNSAGAKIESTIPRGALYIQVFVTENGKLQVGMERLGGTGGFEMFSQALESSEKAREKALRLLNAGAPPSGEFTVVLDPKLTGVFIHEALGHAVEADHVIKGESIVGDKLNTRIASEIVNIYDDPTIEGSFGFYFYDSEGIRAKSTPIVEEGVLRSFLHSRESAAKLDQEPTGNGRAQNFNYPPMPRMSNTYIKPGDFTLEEMLEDIHMGVYLLGSKGGEVDPARGVFQFSAEEGFIIRKGEIAEPIRDVALSGETLKILRNVDAIGREFELSVGFCGKNGQLVPVGDGGGSIRTKAVVGGSS